MNIRVLYIVLLILLSSCAKTRYINPDDVEYIKFGYLQKGIETYVALSSWQDVIGSYDRIDTVIENRQFIQEYVELLNSTSAKADSTSGDYRVVSLIKLKDGAEHYVCLGETFGLAFDSIILQDNKRIFDFVDSVLYTKEQLKKFHRMNMEHTCTDEYLNSKQFDTDFDSLYQKYLREKDYVSYSIAIGALRMKLCEE